MVKVGGTSGSMGNGAKGKQAVIGPLTHSDDDFDKSD